MNRTEFLASLLPPDPEWLGTGALYRAPRPTDWSMLLEPAIAQGVHQGVTNADLTRYLTGTPYDQGPTGACVAASWCSLGSLDEAMLGQPWPVYDWLALYHENGGIQSNGVDTQQVAKDLIANGYPGVNPRQKVVASYLWAPQTPGLFRQTLKAAIAAGRPCKLALLLPARFGWNSSGGRTSGYHEVTLVGDDGPNAVIYNTWGPGWPQDGAPKPGLGRLAWDYLEADNCQNGYCYALTVAPLEGSPIPQPQPQPQPKPQPDPAPQPTPQRVVTATATGGGLSTLAVGQDIGGLTQQGFQGKLNITQISDGGNVIPPPPPPPPPPPGGLKVSLARGRGYVAATVKDGETYLQASCDLVLAGVDRGVRQTTPSGATAIAAIWTAANVPSGAVAVVTATAVDGRTGSGTITL